MADFITWLNGELDRRGWPRAEAARRGDISESMFSKVIGGFNKPGPHFCRGIAKAFEMPPDEVFRLAGILPTMPAPRVRARRIVYEAATGDRILALWRGLTPDDQALVLTLLERLAALEPRIIGDDT